MTFKFKYGDIAIDRVSGDELHVKSTADDKVLFAWIEDGKPQASQILQQSNPRWAARVMRNGKQVWPEPEPEPELKFGDRVVDSVTPESPAVFLEYMDAGAFEDRCRVAYLDEPDKAVTIEHRPIRVISKKE